MQERMAMRILALMTVTLLLAAAGCSDDDPAGLGSVTGAVRVTVSPDTLAAPWQMVGPAGFVEGGAGNAVVPEAPVGDYTLAFGTVTGWHRPAPYSVTGTVTEGDTLVLAGDYVWRASGTVNIDITPDAIDAPWALAYEGEVMHNGHGDSILVDLLDGSYVMVWGEVDGWTGPLSTEFALQPEGTVSLTPVYEEDLAELPYPANPNLAMANFVTIYNTLDTGNFPFLLHEFFQMELLPSTLGEWEPSANPLPEDRFYRSDMIRIHQNMFSGQTGLNPAGTIIPPVASIEVVYLQQLGTWEPIPAEDPTFGGHGGYWVLFEALIYFNNPDFHRFQVDQTIGFYLAPVDDGGQERWELLGIRGLEPMAAMTESVTLGDVLTMYR